MPSKGDKKKFVLDMETLKNIRVPISLLFTLVPALITGIIYVDERYAHHEIVSKMESRIDTQDTIIKQQELELASNREVIALISRYFTNEVSKMQKNVSVLGETQQKIVKSQELITNNLTVPQPVLTGSPSPSSADENAVKDK